MMSTAFDIDQKEFCRNCEMDSRYAGGNPMSVDIVADSKVRAKSWPRGNRVEEPAVGRTSRAPPQVLRRGVSALMAGSPAAKVILIRAPAGFGKTTVMLQHRNRLGERGIATAWLTLNDGGNDISCFLDCLEDISLDGRTTVAAARDVVARSRSITERALDIVERISNHVEPYALFVDDFEHVKTPGVLALVRQILENLPRHGQLIIGSRSLPDLGLGRLRAHGHLLEIGPSSLRFSIEETAEFFACHRHMALTVDDLSRLHQKTDGWVTALWLASAALEHHPARRDFIRGFSGSDRALTDYLVEEVLVKQPTNVRKFLLRTSILKHLSASLCDALLPGANSAVMLRQLESANVFLTPIEGEEQTYRYHSLFSDFLQAQLMLQEPGELPRLHRLAASWYEAQQRPVPAIDHAIESGDFEHAIRLLERHAMSLLSEGRVRLLSRWFSALPAGMLRDKPMLQVAEIWARTGTRGPHRGMELLQSSGLEASRDDQVLPYVRALRPVLLAAMDRYEEAGKAGREALSMLPTSVPFADALLANSMAAVLSVLGEEQEAKRLLEAARRTQGESVSALNMMYSETVDAISDLREGRLREAMARFRVAAVAKSTAWSGVLYAETLYESNDQQRATQLLRVYMPLIGEIGAADQLIIGRVILSRIAFNRGDLDQAFEHLAELEYIGHQRQLPRVVASSKLERGRMRLLQGYEQAAKDELDRANDREVWQRVAMLRLPANDLEDMDLGQWRWEILAGKPQDVLIRLERAISDARAASRDRRALKLLLMLGIGQYRAGNAHAAVATMQHVLKVACGEGFVRLILDEGLPAGRLLKLFESTFRANGGACRDPVFAEYLQRLLLAFGSGLTEVEIVEAKSSHPPLEPLTCKEMRVLRLLTEGYSNNVMAKKLFVSDSTVRTHLRNINAKLDARSRTQAVAIARRLGMVC
jgi:LuxR family maltose regulon positive regulatory protein